MDNCVVNAVGTGSGELGGVAGKFSRGASIELTDCRIGTDLTLTGKVEAGGIAGIVDQCGAQITGCAVDTVLRTEGQDRQTTTIAVNGGGMIGKAYRGETNVTSCDVRADFDGVAGGIVGRRLSAVTLLNCTNKGLVYHSTNATPPYPAYIGGLAPGWGMEVTAENCKVDGDVVFMGRLAHLRIGGLMGRGGTVMKNCMVTGDVAASISPLEEDGALEGMSTDVCYIGGLVGEGSGVILDASYHSGSVRTSTTHEGYHFLKEDPLVGGGDFSRQNMPGAPESTRDDESYIIYVYGHALNSQAMLPLPGATVSIDGTVVGTTDDSGMLTLSGSAVSDRSMVKISAEAEGYFECSTVDFLCHGGSVQLILKKKEEGKIYLTSALIETDDKEMQEMLYSRNSVNILQNDMRAQHFYFSVDWNDTQSEGRKLQLVDKDGNPRITLTAGMDMYFQLTKIFEPNEKPELSAASFQLMTNGEIGLKAVATNAGSAPLAEMTMEIYRCDSDGTRMGDVLAVETFEAVCSGSYRQLMLDEVVMDTLYKVVLTSGGEEVDNQMLMWSEPEVSGAWITGVELSEEGVAKVKLSAQNWTENLMLHLAVYDENGRMVANTMESLDAWTGAKSLEYDFAEELTGGKYTCSAFLLKKDGLIPVTEKLSDSVTIQP